MATCPRDGTKIDHEYGMTTCPTCGSILFVDFNGEAQIEETPSEAGAAPQPEFVPNPSPEEMADPLGLMDLGSDDSQGFESLPSETQDVEPSMATPTESSDPLGLSDYANSEYSQAKDGPFLFRLEISGIDTKELREALREALSDRRFTWSGDEILHKRLKMGRLVLADLSPVKCSILVSRLKRLPVQIRWEQYAVTLSEPGSPETPEETT